MAASPDIKGFMNLSGRLMLGDLGGEPMRLNVRPGEWVVTYERDDDHDIVEVSAAVSDIKMEGGAFIVDDELTVERGRIDMRSGVLFCTDERLGMAMPESFDIPERRLNPKIVGKYGKPRDVGKTPSDSFAEYCYHLCRDHASGMPMCEGTPYGLVSWLGKGESRVTILKDAMRDVVGIEVEV